LIELKRYQEALAAAERSLQLERYHVAAFDEKAKALWKLKRYSASLQARQQASWLRRNMTQQEK
jgi:tetratricopeptide (TPR) repeat protein